MILCCVAEAMADPRDAPTGKYGSSIPAAGALTPVKTRFLRCPGRSKLWLS